MWWVYDKALHSAGLIFCHFVLGVCRLALVSGDCFTFY